MDADEYARMTDEERADFLRGRHNSGLVAATVMAVVLIVTFILLIAFGDDTPMCGTGQDMHPC